MAYMNHEAEYDQINLMDYVKVLIKRKRLIFTVFLIFVIAAWVFSSYSPKVYKIDTALEVGEVEIGAIPETKQVIEEPAQVVGKIESDAYGILVRETLSISEEEYPEIKVENPENTSLVIVAITSSEPELAQNILKGINALIIGEHFEKIKSEKELLEKKIVLLEENINNSKKNVTRVHIKIASLKQEQQNFAAKVAALQTILPFEQDPGTQFALFDAKERLEKKKQEIEDHYLEIIGLENKTNTLRGEIDTLQRKKDEIRPTAVVKQPTVSNNPIRPRVVLNILLAAVLGIFIGIFLAFTKEWWEKNK